MRGVVDSAKRAPATACCRGVARQRCRAAGLGRACETCAAIFGAPRTCVSSENFRRSGPRRAARLKAARFLGAAAGRSRLSRSASSSLGRRPVRTNVIFLDVAGDFAARRCPRSLHSAARPLTPTLVRRCPSHAARRSVASAPPHARDSGSRPRCRPPTSRPVPMQAAPAAAAPPPWPRRLPPSSPGPPGSSSSAPPSSPWAASPRRSASAAAPPPT
jgi:hypothetical protein